MTYFKILASDIVLILFYIFGFSAQSYGIQVGLKSACTFGPSISPSCNMSPTLSINARTDRISPNEGRITLMFFVPEQRGDPCLSYRSSASPRWGWSCQIDNHLNQYNFLSFGYGVYSLSFTETDLFSGSEMYWYFNISGTRCRHEICTLRLNASNVDNCSTWTSSLPFEVNSAVSRVSPPNGATALKPPSKN